eukprot:1079335-Rhodomonas_salina.1
MSKFTFLAAVSDGFLLRLHHVKHVPQRTCYGSPVRLPLAQHEGRNLTLARYSRRLRVGR